MCTARPWKAVVIAEGLEQGCLVSNPSSTLTSGDSLGAGPSMHPVHTRQTFIEALRYVQGLSWPQFLHLPNGNNSPPAQGRGKD